MKTVWRGLLMAGILLLGTLLPASGTTGAAETVIAIRPASVQTAPGHVLTVEIYATQAANLAAFEFFLHFDPTILHATHVEAGEFLTASGRRLVPLGPDLQADRIGFGVATYGEEPGVSGEGVIARLTLHVVGSGTSPLRFQRLIITDPDANELPVRGVDGQVISSGEAFQVRLPLVMRKGQEQSR